jgi:hypothetical protein
LREQVATALYLVALVDLLVGLWLCLVGEVLVGMVDP